MSRVAIPILILVLLAGTLAGCGNGDKASPPASTISPSAAASGATTLSPGPQGSPQASTQSPGASPSATGTTAANGAGGSDGSGGASGSEPITDKTIRANILRRLAQSPALNGLRFKVQVLDRTVILTGKVKTKAQKREAEQIAVSEPGIKKVVSYVFVVNEGDGGY